MAFILGHHIDPESNLQTLLHGAQDLAAGYMSGKLLLELERWWRSSWATI